MMRVRLPTLVALVTVIGATPARVVIAQRLDSTLTAVTTADYSVPVIYKDPALARVLGLMLPGAGQLYTSKPAKALIVFALASAGAYSLLSARRSGPYADGSGLSDEKVYGIALVSVGWLYGIWSAGQDAKEYNRSLKARRR